MSKTTSAKARLFAKHFPRRSTRTVPADLPTRSRSKPQTSCNEPSVGVRLTDRAEGHAMSNANDDKSPLIDLLTCIVCSVTMQIATSVPEAAAKLS
jgi:hypothetical protein